MHIYTSLALFEMPAWAFGTVQRYRELASIPLCVNDVTLFMAIGSNKINSLPDHECAQALRHALGMTADNPQHVLPTKPKARRSHAT
jgi:hypothetical protein